MKKYLKTNFGFVLLSIILGVLYSGLNVYAAIILQKVIDAAEYKNLQRFIMLTIGALIYVIFLTWLQFLYLSITKYLVAKIIKALRQDVFQGIFNQNYVTYTKVNTADYISALTNDVKIIEEDFIIPFIRMIQNIFMFTITTFLLIKLSITVTISLSICLILMFLVPQLTGCLLQKNQRDYSEQIALFTEKIKDFFGGYEVIKAFNIYEVMNKRFNKYNDITTKVKFSKERAFALNESLSCLLSFIAQFAVLFVAAYLIIIDKITMGVLVALIQLSNNFVNPVGEIMNCFADIKSVTPIVKRLVCFSDNKKMKSFKQLPTFEKRIVLKNLTFSYDKDSEPILKEINFIFEKNKKYAIVGESGCGKSTLLKIISGYFTEYNGEILFDGVELRNLDTSQIGRVVSTVHQNVFIFDDDIYENICLYQNYNNEQLEECIKLSGVDLFLKEQKEGIKTHVGEGAKNLSGGQKQRIGVARALITRPQLLILDEGTASLDLKTAHDIEERLLGLNDLTMITITHNTNSDLLERYDQILRIKEGHILSV